MSEFEEILKELHRQRKRVKHQLRSNIVYIENKYAIDRNKIQNEYEINISLINNLENAIKKALIHSKQEQQNEIIVPTNNNKRKRDEEEDDELENNRNKKPKIHYDDKDIIDYFDKKFKQSMPCTSKQIIELSELDYQIEKKLEEQKDDDDDEYIDLAVIQSILAEEQITEQTKTNDLD